MKDSLPSSWILAELKDLSKLINGDRGKNYPNRSALVPNGIPFINAGHLEDGIIQLSKMNFITEERFNLLGNGKVEENDILYCLRGSLGKTALVQGFDKGAIASSLVILRSFHNTEPKYLFYFLISPLGKAEILKHDNGSAQPNLSAKSVSTYSVPLPPVNEQRRIVAKIEALSDRSQKARTALAEVPNLIDQFRQSVLAAAFRGDLTADWRKQHPNVEPHIWKDFDLQSLLAEPLSNGKSVPDAVDEGFPVLRLTCLKGHTIDLTERKMGDWTREKAKKFLVQEGDFLVSRGNGSLSLVGRGSLVDEVTDEVAYPDTLIRVRVNQDIILPKFLSVIWNSKIIRNQVERAARTTAGIYKINQKSLQAFKLNVPPISEQIEIINYCQKIDALIAEIEDQVLCSYKNVVSLEQSILAKAFRGDLVPQDPTDEPASVLLERIRAEREKLGTTQKKRRSSRKKNTK